MAATASDSGGTYQSVPLRESGSEVPAKSARSSSGSDESTPKVKEKTKKSSSRSMAGDGWTKEAAGAKHCTACGVAFGKEDNLIVVNGRCTRAVYHKECTFCDGCGKKVGALVFVVQMPCLPFMCCSARCPRDRVLCAGCARPPRKSTRDCYFFD